MTWYVRVGGFGGHGGESGGWCDRGRSQDCRWWILTRENPVGQSIESHSVQ